MSNPVRLGVIGLGDMGLLHYRAAELLEDVVVAATSDSSGRRDIDGTFFADPQELLTSGTIDVVTIATPPAGHFRFASIALQNGLGVLCEKPLAARSEDASRLAALAAGPGQIAVVSHQLRFETSRRAVRDLLATGEMGEPYFASFIGLHPRMESVRWGWWSQSSEAGGMLREFGSHLVDLALWMFGPARLITGDARSVITSRVDSGGLNQVSDSDDIATLSIVHESGLQSVIHVAGLGRSELRSVYVECSRGSILIDSNDLVRVERENGQRFELQPWSDTYPSLTADPSDHWTPPFVRMMERWLKAYRGEEFDPDLCTFGQAAEVIRIIEEVSPP